MNDDALERLAGQIAEVAGAALVDRLEGNVQVSGSHLERVLSNLEVSREDMLTMIACFNDAATGAAITLGVDTGVMMMRALMEANAVVEGEVEPEVEG